MALAVSSSRFDILTYRKGKTRAVAAHRFVLRRATIDHRAVEYRLHDQAVRFLNGRLRLRQVTRLSDDGQLLSVLHSLSACTMAGHNDIVVS